MPSSKKRKGKQSDPSTWEDEEENEQNVISEEEANADKIARASRSLLYALCYYLPY
jgi:hypothetical protein